MTTDVKVVVQKRRTRSSGFERFAARGNKPFSGASYREVLAALDAAGLPARTLVIDRFRGRNGRRDRWSVADVRAMCDAITASEDDEELRVGGRVTETRDALRAIRRRLELEAFS